MLPPPRQLYCGTYTAVTYRVVDGQCVVVDPSLRLRPLAPADEEANFAPSSAVALHDELRRILEDVEVQSK